MVSSMVQAHKISAMVITTKANMLMGSQKGLDSMNGMMEVFIKVILNKGFDVDMECGV